MPPERMTDERALVPWVPRVGVILSSKKRPNPCKNWCFTWNNYSEYVIALLLRTFRLLAAGFVFQEEIGESGTPHLQGYVSFATKTRPSTFLKDYWTSAHWSPTRGIRDSIRYCSDVGKRKVGGRCWHEGVVIPRSVEIIPFDEMYAWQKELIRFVLSPPSSRQLFWIWDPIGNVGKTAVTRYLALKHLAIIGAGKASDLKYMVASFFHKHGGVPPVVICDIPRSNMQYVSYAGIEKVKDATFGSTKYESVTVVCPYFHVVCFANQPPDFGVMSADRWRVGRLQRVPDGLRIHASGEGGSSVPCPTGTPVWDGPSPLPPPVERLV